MSPTPARPTILVAVAVCAMIAVIALQNAAITLFFPSLARLTTDFSPTYLHRELRRYADEKNDVIFLGDSVLWGYRVRPSETAIALLAKNGCACRNLAFKSGNPANDYLLSLLLRNLNARPRVVILEVNQAVLNQADNEYQTVHPAIWSLGQTLLTQQDRTSLTAPAMPSGGRKIFERTASSLSLLYAMRSDIHATLYGDVPPPPSRHIVPALFEGTFDLSPLDNSNIGVHFLSETVEELKRSGIPVVAFHTPVNHALLHDFIDNAQYRANSAFLTHVLRSQGADVLDLDAAVPSNEFLDELHLTPTGQRHLAASLGRVLNRYIHHSALRHQAPGRQKNDF